MPQNYLTRCQFGDYPAGTVLPEHVVEAGHDLAALVASELVVPTDLAVTVEIKPPTPAAASMSDDVYAERNRLAAENVTLAAENKTIHGHAADWKRRHDALQGTLAEYVGEVDRLKANLSDERAAHAATKQEMEAAHALLAEAPPAAPKSE